MSSRAGEETDPAARVREICLRLLAGRPRTRAELARAVADRGITDEAAEPVLDRYVEVGLIDDAAFAETYVRSARQQRGLGRAALHAELRRRGVGEEVTRAAVDRLDGSAEEATARELVRRRLRTMGNVDAGTRLRRLVAMLGRKGYAPELVWRVVRGQLEGVADELDELCDAE